MILMITIEEICEKGLWDEYCELSGTNVWARNEGQILSTDTVNVPESMICKFMPYREYVEKSRRECGCGGFHAGFERCD